MTSIISIQPCSCLHHSSSRFSHTARFPNIPNCSSPSICFSSIHGRELKIRCENKETDLRRQRNKQKQNSGDFAGALETHQSHRNRTEKSRPNNRTTTEKNEEKKNDYRNPAPEKPDLNKRKIEPSLSGEDILLALQRASVEKTKQGENRKLKQKGERSKRGVKDMKKRRVIGEVRPISVKAEWGARIESLEQHLKELKERADAS